MQVVIYTRHASTAEALQKMTGGAVLQQNRATSVVEDIRSQIQPPAVVVGVMPLDQAIELTKAGYAVVLASIDAKKFEQITGQKYDPKADYPWELVSKALVYRVVNVKDVKYLNAAQLGELVKNGFSLFNDDMRRAVEMVTGVQGAKEGRGIQINPLQFEREAVFISLPPVTQRLTAEQIAEMIADGRARIYVVQGSVKTYDSLAEAVGAALTGQERAEAVIKDGRVVHVIVECGAECAAKIAQRLPTEKVVVRESKAEIHLAAQGPRLSL